MRQATTHRIARAIAKRLASDVSDRRGRKGMVDGIYEEVDRILEDAQGGSQGLVAPGTVAVLLGHPGRRTAAFPERQTPHRELAVKALTLATACVRDELRGLPRAEREACVQAMAELGIPVTEPVPADVGTDGPWQGSYSVAVSRGSRPDLIGRVDGTYVVERLDADEAPVAVRLATPSGGRIDVRLAGRTWLRPVLSPGTWEPCGIGEFLDATGNAAAWRDDPFRPDDAHTGCAFSLRDLATPVSGDPALLRIGAAGLDVGARLAGPLRCVDGVVHVETEGPVLDVVYATGRDGCFRSHWTWRCGTLDGTSAQDTVVGREAGRAIALADMYEQAGAPRVDASLPVWDVESAILVRSAWTSLVRRSGQGARTPDMAAPRRDVAEVLVPVPYDAADRGRRCLRAALGTFHGISWEHHRPRYDQLGRLALEALASGAEEALARGDDPSEVASDLRRSLPKGQGEGMSGVQLLGLAFVKVAAKVMVPTDEPLVDPDVASLAL